MPRRKMPDNWSVHGGSDGPPPDDPDDPGPQDETEEEDDRQICKCRKGRLDRIVERCIEHLPDIEGIYARGGMLVRVCPPVRGDPACIREVGTDDLGACLCGVLSFAKPVRRGDQYVWTPCDPPSTAVIATARRGHWPGMRQLVGIQTTPPIRPDGSILWAEGYDAETGAYYSPGGDVLERSRITRDIAVEGLTTLRDLVADFPWLSQDGDADAWIACAVLSPLVRIWSGPAPMLLISATSRSAGKTLLADVAGIITGSHPGHLRWAMDDEEIGKQILALALSGAQSVLLDNIRRGSKLGGSALDMALTSERIHGRVLGRSMMVDIPLRACWIATGNNVSLSEDTARRAIVASLATDVENPEDRTDYTIRDLRSHAKRCRPGLLGAALAIIAGYLRAGAPEKPPPIGSYERWSEIVRGAVIWAGGTDVGELLGSRLETSDTDADAHRWMLRVWLASQPERGMTAQEGYALADGQHAVQDVSDLIAELGIRNGRSLSMRLSGLAGRPREIDGHMLALVRAGKSSSGAWLWRVEDVHDGQPPTPLNTISTQEDLPLR